MDAHNINKYHKETRDEEFDLAVDPITDEILSSPVY